MRRLAVISVLAMLALPASAGAEDTCRGFASDPAGDSTGWPSGLPAASAASGAVDLLGLDMDFDGGNVLARIRVADLGGALDTTANLTAYSIQFSVGDVMYDIYAYRYPEGWWFQGGKTKPGPAYGIGSHVTARGLVREADNVIELSMPLTTIDDASAGTVLHGVRAQAHEARHTRASGGWVNLPTHVDYAPDGSDGAEFVLAPTGCVTPIAHAGALAPTCVLAADPVGDVALHAGVENDAAVDLVGLRAGSDGNAMTFDLLVNRAPDNHLFEVYAGRLYEISWDGGLLRAWYESGESFSFETNTMAGTTTGTADFSTQAIRISVLLSQLGIESSAELRNIVARSYRLEGQDYPVRDEMHAVIDYSAGGTCGSFPPPPACDPIDDPAGDVDAGQWASVNPGGPSATPWLDLVAAGVSGTEDSIELSIRVVDLRSIAQAPSQTIGWAVSWYDGGVRYAGEVLRASDGIYSFIVNSFSPGYTDMPIYFWDGHHVDGSVDVASGRLVVRVPRTTVGNPALGQPMEGVGALSFVVASVDDEDGMELFGTSSEVDRTKLRRYAVGASCPA